ncbi:MAG: hypothetical protein A2Y62_09430 [Candidatus Fischerbacteria bacterium RBG_13_37_8]|uniref:FHA domain-containing protein n=1 Tax=Candidatus Fischerbacteria bacterium RBG_13_37_8 TaxID=1817863 RepID=A0A1F5VUR0_9BACT|nr:MAG: hypothetical protein A2Y62_09430 [Candidatus Fischerbacteria bacterium RBG_13_37_8]
MALIKFAVPTYNQQQEYEYEVTEEEISIGRDADNQIALEDEHASRYHARIVLTASGYMLVDNNSANGTFVQKKRIEKYVIKECDEGFCYTSGGTHSNICVQKESVPNSGRLYNESLRCHEGYKEIRDHYTRLILECVPLEHQ